MSKCTPEHTECLIKILDMHNTIEKLSQKIKQYEREKSSKKWEKVEDKSLGGVSWTEYTDTDGMVYTIYDLQTNPATPNAYIK